jgi:F0F1-type ATP synthase membrane subunit b/b'
MLAFVLLLLAESTSASGGGFSAFWNKYLNYPGFEAWKFINLAIFVGLLIYLLKKPLSDTFKAKREQIRAELIKAEEEKQAAMAKLTETEAKLARLDSEKETVLSRAKEEAKAEEKRIADAKHELRKLSAEETVRRAEEMIKANLAKGNDAGLVKTGITSLGGAK